MLQLLGGREGFPNPGYLESALSAAPQIWHYHPDCDLYDLAAAYLWHIAKAHAFLDGNKRTGYATALIFLSANGVLLDQPEDRTALADLAIQAVEGSVSREQVGAFIRDLARQQRRRRRREEDRQGVVPPRIRGRGAPWQTRR